jgi:site-specific DNA-methyltransferase (adenine-specific)
VHNDSKEWSAVSDRLLYYVKQVTERYTWNPPILPHSEEHIRSKYSSHDPDGRAYTLDNMTSPNPRPNMMYEWKGHASPAMGWRYERSTMERLDAEGRIWYPDSKDKRPRLKRYLDEMAGTLATNVWTDIAPVNSQAKERLGYPTQKPLALLERILAASSNPGDIVLDPFCGCGTALVAAQKLDRRWVGIDVTCLSIAVMRARLKDSFGLADVDVIGQPTEVDGARAMLVGTGLEGQYQFQWWALDLVGAQPLGGQKKGADRGIDGVISFSTGPRGEVGRALVSVKSGSVNSSMVRDLKGVLDREKAEIGLFVTLEEPSGPMQLEATTAGVYRSELSGRDYQRIQILTIRELLEEHRRPDLPLLVLPAYQQAERVARKAAEQGELFG